MGAKAEALQLVKRAPALLIAGAALAWTGWTAANYPIVPALVVAITVLWTAAVMRWPCAWPGVVLALVPAVGFASWTGWFAVEEFDLLLGGVAAAGYLVSVRRVPSSAGKVDDTIVVPAS